MPQVDLSGLAISIVILGIITSIGAVVLINVRDTQTSGTPGYNLSDEAAIGYR